MATGNQRSIKEIALALDCSKEAVRRQIERENIRVTKINGNGGEQNMVDLADMPAKWQLAIYNKEGEPVAMLCHLSPSALAIIAEKNLALSFTTTNQIVVDNKTPPVSRRKAIPETTSPRENLPAVPTLYNTTTSLSPMQGCGPEMSPARTYDYEKLPAWSPERAISLDTLTNPRVAKLLKIIREVESMPVGWPYGNRKWAESVARDNKCSFQHVYAVMAKYNKRGLAGLEHRKSTRGEGKAWCKEALDWWISLCFKPEHRKMDLRSLYNDILIIEAHRREWQIGGLESARWWYNKKKTPALLAYQRGGIRALDNILPPTLRKYNDMAPFEMLVGDQHRWDFWVVDDDTGAVFRPEAYLWQDLRTRLIYGAAFDRRYDAQLCGEALRIGMWIWGCFNAIYTDNGSSELSKYIMGILAGIRSWGMEWRQTEDQPVDILDMDGEDINPAVASIAPGTHKKAIVKNAKAKLIEKTFDVLEGILRGHFRLPGSVKRLSDDIHAQDIDHQEAMKLAAQNKLLLASEFYLTVYRAIDYYNREKAHRGVRKEWLWRPVPAAPTPMDCLKACYAEGWRPRYITPEAADTLFLRRVMRTVTLGRVTLDNELYEHEALMELHGERVDVRFNTIESDVVLIYRGGQYLCTAHPVEYSSMKDEGLARRKIMEKRAKRKAIADKFREITRSIPDFREYSCVPEAERVAAQIGNEQKRRQLIETERTRELTQEELDAAVAKLEQGMPLPAKSKRPVPERPGCFMNDQIYFEWIQDVLKAGGALSAEDEAFKTKHLAEMSPGEREYYDFVMNEYQGD